MLGKEGIALANPGSAFQAFAATSNVISFPSVSFIVASVAGFGIKIYSFTFAFPNVAPLYALTKTL